MPPKDVAAKDVMENEVEVITPEVSVTDAYDLMNYRGIGHFPVVADLYMRQVLGIISDTDLIPYSPPKDKKYPDEARYIKGRISIGIKLKVEDVLTPMEKIHSLIFEDEKAASFLHKFFRTEKPAFNLLMVFNNDIERSLVGVISWIDILKKWDSFLTKEIQDELNKLRALDLAVPLGEVPSLDTDKNVTIQTALRRKDLSVHRHIPIIEKGKVIKLFHFHELMPYMPINDAELDSIELKRLNLQLADYFDSLSIHDIPETHTVLERTIPEDMPIWTSDGTPCVIQKFLGKTVGYDWKDRLAGLLLQSKSSEELTHLLNPYDIIAWLAKKKVV